MLRSPKTLQGKPDILVSWSYVQRYLNLQAASRHQPHYYGADKPKRPRGRAGPSEVLGSWGVDIDHWQKDNVKTQECEES